MPERRGDQARRRADEDRVKTIGRTASGRILAAVFTFRGEAIRPITAYDATTRDQSLYLKGSS
jgi:uncharacterized DUF497 family protein